MIANLEACLLKDAEVENFENQEVFEDPFPKGI